MTYLKTGRNDPCPCGSGKKFKQCCQNKADATSQIEVTVTVKSPSKMIQAALAHHKAGQLLEAETLYQQVLQIAPDNPDALHLSGVIALDAGKLDLAVELISKAIKIRPSSHMHFNLGNALKAKGKLDDAIKSYRIALSLQTDYVDVYRNLGITLSLQGKLNDALASFQRAIALQPNYAEVHSNLGMVLVEQGKLEKAVLSYQKAISLKPDYAEAYCNLGVVLKKQGKLDLALEHYLKAISLKPDYVEAYSNMGNALVEMREFDLAINQFQQSIQLKPDFAEGHNNLGNVYKAQGKLDEALESYHKALSLKPDFAMAYNNCGNILEQKNALNLAIDFFKQALALDPNFADAHYNLGNTLQRIEKLDAALVSYQRAIALRPDFAMAYNNMGNVLKTQSKLDEAMASYLKALEYEPDLVVTHNNIGSVFLDQGNTSAAITCFNKAVTLDPQYFDAHSNILLSMCYDENLQKNAYFAEACRYGEKVSAAAKPYRQWNSQALGTDGKTLRVGLVSGDFRSHPVGFFLENIIAHIDPSRFTLVAYSTQPQEDALTARIKSRFAQWNCISDLDDARAAQKIHNDGIDILIDLAGHTAHNRLPVFAWKPAPLQLSWLGYFATTGVPGMDFLLTDKVAAPENQGESFSESLYYLPNTRLCFTAPAPADTLPVSTLPAIRLGHITFGCFQNLSKLNDRVLTAWGQIFNALPNATLQLQNRQMTCSVARQNLLERLANVGIKQERVNLQAYVPRETYLVAHNEIDFMLDTFPYPGGTTTCEALWMAVPTITLAGNTMLSRQGASILTCAGLTDWIANSEGEYVTKAVAHATNLEQLAQLRSRLRHQVLASPLFDAQTFALRLEDTLQEIWQNF